MNLMEEVLGVEPIELTDKKEKIDTNQEQQIEKYGHRGPITTPDLIRISHKRVEIQKKFLHLLEARHFREATYQASIGISKGKKVTLPILRSGSVIQNLDAKFVEFEKKAKVKITVDDIEDEVAY
uniref:Uncharacterized protein n=1 Tax=Cannabis sativa TaxID=3483 RepID=A0A803PEX4_CANSA